MNVLVYCSLILYFALQCFASHIGTLERKQSEILKIVTMGQNRCTTDKDCTHGYCDKISKMCSCESGWTGKTCNELMAYKKISKNNGRDIKQNKQKEKVNAYLIDIFSKLGKRQRSRNHPFDVTANLDRKKTRNPDAANQLREIGKDSSVFVKPVPTTKTVSEKTDVIEAIVDEFEESDACSDRYRYKTPEKRRCTTGLECEFGTCSAVNYGSYIAFECKCDRGANGLLCEQRCCKDCGKNGRCDFYPDGKQFCVCRRGFYGYRCQFSFSKIEQKEHIPIVATSSSLSQQL